MLRKVNAANQFDGYGKTFVIVASRYNARYVDSMIAGAKRVLATARARTRVVRVPGAFEIPLATQVASRQEDCAGIICLGVILRGATRHADFIAEAVTRALMEIQLRQNVPVIHEVLLLEDHTQARERCMDRKTNRGIEAAQTALEMDKILAGLRVEPE